MHAKVFLNVVLNLGCCRCCKGYDWFRAYFTDDWPDTAVFRTEIVSPHSDMQCASSTA